jgi:ABC-2 type transport system permease protein
MRVFGSMLKMFVQQQILHREYWLIFVLNGILPIVVPLLAWIALSKSVDHFEIDGWNIEQFVAYYLINFVIFSLSFTSIHEQMSELVRTGQLNYWLLRPVNFFELALSFSASRIFVMFCFVVPIFMAFSFLGVLFFHSFAQLLIALLVIPLAIVLLVLITICIGNLSFWLIESSGAFAAILLFLQFFGGLILPVSLFPDWIRPISAILPLQFAFSLPSETIVNGSIGNVLFVLIGQCAWIHITYLAICVLWKKGLSHYDAVGA